jgi:hypothetical protein
MELLDILPKLQDWFAVEDHRERTIKGGGRWYYVPHQSIRDRLNEVCPSQWSTAYDGPHMIDGEPIYHCHLTICGVTRTGIGDKSNEPSPYGTAAQRAFRKAFTDAAEQFGIGGYLDEQTSEKTKRSFIKYMQSQSSQSSRLSQSLSNGKAITVNQRQQVESGESPQPRQPRSVDASDQPFSKTQADPEVQGNEVITDAQRKRLYAIATQEGKYSDYGFRRLIEIRGFTSSRAITQVVYDELCDCAQNPELAAFYNQEISAQAS